MSKVSIFYGDLLTSSLGSYTFNSDQGTGGYYVAAKVTGIPIVFYFISTQGKSNFTNVEINDQFTIRSKAFSDNQERILTAIISPTTIQYITPNNLYWLLESQLGSINSSIWTLTPVGNNSGVYYGDTYMLTSSEHYITSDNAGGCNIPVAYCVQVSTNSNNSHMTLYDQDGKIPTLNSILRCCEADNNLGPTFCGDYWGPTSPGQCDQPMTDYCGSCTNLKSTDPSCGCITSCINAAATCFDGKCVNTDAFRTYAMRTSRTPCSELCQIVINSTGSDVDINQGIFCNDCGSSAPTICGSQSTGFFKYWWIILIALLLFLIVLGILFFVFRK